MGLNPPPVLVLKRPPHLREDVQAIEVGGVLELGDDADSALRGGDQLEVLLQGHDLGARRGSKVSKTKLDAATTTGVAVQPEVCEEGM